MKSPLDSLFFIQLKDAPSLSGSGLGGLDLGVPLPVRVEGGDGAPSGDAVLAALSEESVLAGILAVFAWDAENPHREHYRALAARLRPNMREELAETALVKMRNGDEDEAEEILLALRGMNPADREVALNLAILNDGKARRLLESGAGDHRPFAERAERLYAESMRMDPPLPETFFNAGYFYLWQGNYARALEALETYLALEARSSEAAETRKAKAAALARGIESRGLSEPLFKAARDAIMAGEEERGIGDIRRFLEGRPDVWNAWFLLGWALRRLERWGAAKEAFLRALELRREAEESGEDETGEGLADICNEIAICSMEESCLEEARRWLVAALEHDPENTKVIANLGVLAWKEGDLGEAEGFFRAAVEINPNDGAAAQLLKEVRGF